MYEKNYAIERYDTDQKGRLKPPVLIKMLSDIMERNANSYGAGAAYHLYRNLAWVLTEYELDIFNWPAAEQSITVGTLPYAFKKMYGFRIYSAKDALGNTLMEGKGKFILINIKTKEMVKPDREILDKFTDAIDEPTMLKFDKWKLDVSKPVHTFERTVTHDLIDVNDHLNNAHSVTLAYEAMDPNYLGTDSIRRLHVRFRKEAFKGDKLRITLYQMDEGYGVLLKRDDQVISEVVFKV